MYWRFQADNFFVTTITNDQTLVPWVDGVINALEVPNIEPWKLFYVIFRVDDINNRFTLPVYVENNQMKYKGYNVKSQFELKAYDTISLNDLAENFNYLFNNIDDIWTIVKKWGLDILVYGWKIIKWWINVDIADTTITLPDNSSRYVVFDYSDSTLKAVTSLDNLSHYCFAEVTTFGWEVTNIESKKSFNAWEIFSNAFFERNSSTWAIQIKDWAIKKDDIDLSTLNSDDIAEWATNKYFKAEAQATLTDVNNKKHTHSNKAVLDWITQEQLNWYATRSELNNYQTKANMKTDLNNPDNTTYPTTKAVVDAIELAWGWDMMKATYDPNNKRADVFNMDNMTEWTNKSSVIKSTTAPSNPTQWMVWYDTTNNKLKTYNWSSWDIAWGDESNTKTFYLANVDDLTNAQAAYDYYKAWGNPIVVLNKKSYFLIRDASSQIFFSAPYLTKTQWSTHSTACIESIAFNISNWQVTYIPSYDFGNINYIDTSVQYQNSFIPTQPHEPATKKYVDDTVSSAKATWDTAPSNPVEWQLWYDTTNDVLKIYDWSSWNVIWWDESNTKTFYLSNTSDLTNAQAAYNWYISGKNPIIVYNEYTYIFWRNDNSELQFFATTVWNTSLSSGFTEIHNPWIQLLYSWNTVTSITTIAWIITSWVLGTNVDYTTPYTPIYDWSPATKKYVDDKTATVSTTAPSNPTEWTLWYDSTNHVLKVYNWTNWVAVWATPWDASSSSKWIVKLWSDTVQTEAAQTVSSTTNRTYAVQNNSNWQMVVNVPWANTTYSAWSWISIDGNNAISADTTVLATKTDIASVLSVSNTVPSSPTEWSMWYSTRLNNSQTKWLKTYDGSNWEKVWYRGKTFFLATLDASTGAEVLNWLYWYKVLTAHSSTPPSSWPTDWTATVVYNNKVYVYNKFETASIDWWRTTSFYFINPEVYRSWNNICQDCLKYTMSNASWSGMNYSFTETQITVAVWAWDVNYSDFVLFYSGTSWSVTIDRFSKALVMSWDTTLVSSNDLKSGMQYIVRIESWATAYTLTLWNWITNPYWESITLYANTTTTLVFLATSSSTLELFTSRTA